ncbi:MAG: NAD(P)H-dependent oxidoreductase [Clostridiaceae bacterium]|nr:NAD(P)H-dependent oxidoreductase [Clostridiaceae bacterium]
MKIVVINGTMVRGCTYHLKESFLEPLRAGNEITEFYLPGDAPGFCTGCKVCFMDSEDKCPHAGKVRPIWQAMLAVDLIVFAYPVYVMRAPGQVKTLLDHFGVHWMVHRPKREMFTKRAVIITQSIGAPNGAAQKDVRTSFHWLGVSSVRRLGFGLMEGVIWDELSEKRRRKLTTACRRCGEKYVAMRPARMNLSVRLMFAICRMLQKSVLKKGVHSTDNRYWIEQGWIRGD